MISRVCEEFGCLPSAAIREVRQRPDLVFDIITMRTYAATREQLHQAKDEASAPTGHMADLVADIEAELFQERRRLATEAEGE